MDPQTPVLGLRLILYAGHDGCDHRHFKPYAFPLPLQTVWRRLLLSALLDPDGFLRLPVALAGASPGLDATEERGLRVEVP